MKWYDLLERLPCQDKRLALIYQPGRGWGFSIDNTLVNQSDPSCEHAVLRGVFEHIINRSYDVNTQSTE
jgi:hypothetical protein